MGKILIIADRDKHSTAINRGLELARRLGCSAEIVAFCYTSLRPLRLKASERSAVKKRLISEREDQVGALIEQACQQGQKVKLIMAWEKDVAPWVIKRCTRPYIAVIKTGCRSESFLYTSTDWQLLRECPRAVLIVAGKKWQRTRPVLASVDLASKMPEKIALNHEVISQAKLYADALATPLSIITAIEVPTLLADLDLLDPVAYAREIKAEMKPLISELAAAHDLPEKLFRIKKGPVARVISSEAARARAQLLVMGTVGRRGIKARLLGNTAEDVLRHIRTDVLAVKLWRA